MESACIGQYNAHPTLEFSKMDGSIALFDKNDVAEAAVLNTDSAEEEKAINDAYYQIGKLYVELRCIEDELASLANSVVSSRKKHGCGTVCGMSPITSVANNADESPAPATKTERPAAEPEASPVQSEVSPDAFMRENEQGKSPAFGSQTVWLDATRNELKPAQTINICPVCGAKVRIGSRFCTVCGQSLTGFAAGAGNPPKYVDYAVPNKKQCPSCGSMMDMESVFCTECGTRLP